MDRTLVIAASAPVPRGNHVEITQLRGDGTVIAVHDLERGIRYQVRDARREDVDVWRGHVRECTVTDARTGEHTRLVVAIQDAAQSAMEALRDADAAAAAAKAESDRWGGADRPPAEVQERFW